MYRPATYKRWATSVSEGFRFAVKVPKEITHQRRLVETTAPLERFLAEVSELDANLGPLLVQLPPNLAFETPVAQAFFACLRARFTGSVVCEARHAGWFRREAERLLANFHIARVAADPAPVPEAAHPGGWPGLAYYRLHGSPRTYYSAYSDDALSTLVQSRHACPAFHSGLTRILSLGRIPSTFGTPHREGLSGFRRASERHRRNHRQRQNGI
jgi:uncharacterized protein YecE (DUF72 family)